MKVKNKTIIVTGAGSGLGQSLTLELLVRGAKIIAIDIIENSLQETKNLSKDLSKNLFIYKLDISNKEEVFTGSEFLIEKFGEIHGLINNAGIIQPFININELDFEIIHKIMNINFFGTVYLTKAFLPHLLKQNEAHIVNISSLGGFMPFPKQTIYGASKAAIKIFTEGLYAELKKTNVCTTVVHPGALRTNILVNSGLNNDFSNKNENNNKALEPNKAAIIIIKSIEKNQYRCTVGNDSKLLDFIYRVSPKYATDLILRKMKNLQLNK